MHKVELVYEKSCPNIQAARINLLQAFSELKLAPKWLEWEVSEADIPAYVLNLGSPTILVNGKDVSGTTEDGHDLSCRVYTDADGNISGVPTVGMIKNALSGHMTINKHGIKSLALNTGMLPAIGTALLPKLACPACWPAYAGLLSAMGIGFIDYTPYLLPLTLVFLTIALVTLAYRASTRRGYAPLVVGFFGSLVLIIGKFGYDSDNSMYLGLAILIGASIWNTWPRKRLDDDQLCTSCIAPQRAT